MTTAVGVAKTTVNYLSMTGLFHKLKRFNRFKPSLGTVIFVSSPLCLLGLLGFFFLDLGCLNIAPRSPFARLTWAGWGGGTVVSSVSSSPPVVSSSVDIGRVGGGGGGSGRSDVSKCDFFDGKWVWDETYPLYESKDCNFLDDGFRCSENGRPDKDYTKWRWQPNQCDLPRFDAKLMLENFRNRRVVFVGDSIGRNQWESLLCMLSTAIPNNNSSFIYEVKGNPITKHMGSLIFMFREYNCTVEYYRAPFLVVQGRAPANAPKGVGMTLRLDRMDWNSWRWKDADVLVFNSGHWWNFEKTIRAGCYFQEGNEVKMNMSVERAFRRSIVTLADWVGSEVNTSKTHVFFRSYSPVHFRNGNWRSGGSCHLETLPEPTSTSSSTPFTSGQFKIVNEVLLSRHASKIKHLNITYMSGQRKDGHSSVYYRRPKPAPLRKQDCSHWCLPGVPDSWNELLFASLQREYNLTMLFSNDSPEKL